jgi:hypothetical protein
MEDTQAVTLEQFITTHNLKLECHRVDSRPDGLMSDEQSAMRHFRCHIRAGATKRTVTHKDTGAAKQFSYIPSLSLYFSQGVAHTEDPTLADVLDCLASDASSYENARAVSGSIQNAAEGSDRHFRSWANDLGYDEDSRSAEEIFRAIKRQAEQLKRALGSEAYNDLLWNTKRL